MKMANIILDILMILAGFAGAVGAAVTGASAMLVVLGIIAVLFAAEDLKQNAAHLIPPEWFGAIWFNVLEKYVENHKFKGGDAEATGVLLGVAMLILKLTGAEIKMPHADNGDDIMDFIRRNDADMEQEADKQADKSDEPPIRKVVL